MPYLCQYITIYLQLKRLNTSRKTPFFVVLKGGLSLKIARFLPVLCPYRGVYRRLSDTEMTPQHTLQHTLQPDFRPDSRLERRVPGSRRINPRRHRSNGV
nr:MAG TPA: hypothetical protein [Bacteriophage sp.]